MTRTVSPGFGTLFSTIASLTSPLQKGSSRPLYETVPQLVIRPKGRRWLTGAIDTLLAWSERARERRQLMQFDDHMLHDIGVTRADVEAEAAKPFWRT